MELDKSYPSPAAWTHASPRQIGRAERTFAILKRRAVPVYHGPLLVEDDEECILQSASDVARRVLVLWGVVLHPDDVPYDELDEVFQERQLWQLVSSHEAEFLRNDGPSLDQKQRLSWRSEAMVVLLWALGYQEALDWPCTQCDVEELGELIMELENSDEFIANAKLRPVAEILDAQDLILRIHWAVRNTHLHFGGMMPVDLDWSGDGEWMPVPFCDACGIAEEQHHTINWLTMGGESPDWDDVDTST